MWWFGYWEKFWPFNPLKSFLVQEKLNRKKTQDKRRLHGSHLRWDLLGLRTRCLLKLKQRENHKVTEFGSTEVYVKKICYGKKKKGSLSQLLAIMYQTAVQSSTWSKLQTWQTWQSLGSSINVSKIARQIGLNLIFSRQNEITQETVTISSFTQKASFPSIFEYSFQSCLRDLKSRLRLVND